MNKNATADTEIKYVDPLTFEELKEGDRVAVTSPMGIVMDFKVGNIGEGGAVGLVPTTTKLPSTQQKLVAATNSVVLASDFRDSRSGFIVHRNDIVVVTDSRGKKTNLRVDLIVGRDFIILGLPGKKNPMGLWSKLKFLWHIGKS